MAGDDIDPEALLDGGLLGLTLSGPQARVRRFRCQDLEPFAVLINEGGVPRGVGAEHDEVIAPPAVGVGTEQRWVGQGDRLRLGCLRVDDLAMPEPVAGPSPSVG